MSPGWETILVRTLGGGRVSKELEHWVLEELPWTRALQYYHAAIFSESTHYWTVYPGSTEENHPPVLEQLGSLEALEEQDDDLED
jgi:hypothetical protein